jgi:hypothetical protein
MSLSPQDLFYMAIGLISIVLLFWFNRHLYRGGGVTGLELLYYLTALAGLLIGWYFNLQYMQQYGAQAGWAHWTRLLFVNPASASGGQDLIIANVILLPLWTIVDGRRCGMRVTWWYFVMSLITSYAFAMALFLAVKERQLRQA